QRREGVVGDRAETGPVGQWADPRLVGIRRSEGREAREVAALTDHALLCSHGLRQLVAEGAALLVAEVLARSRELLLDALRGERRGDDGRVGVLGAAPERAAILQHEHVAEARIAAEIGEAIAVDGE